MYTTKEDILPSFLQTVNFQEQSLLPPATRRTTWLFPGKMTDQNPIYAPRVVFLSNLVPFSLQTPSQVDQPLTASRFYEPAVPSTAT